MTLGCDLLEDMGDFGWLLNRVGLICSGSTMTIQTFPALDSTLEISTTKPENPNYVGQLRGPVFKFY